MSEPSIQAWPPAQDCVLINMTDHVISILSGDEIIEIPQSGSVLRVDWAPIELTYVRYGGRSIEIITDGVIRGVRNLPPPVENTYYLASYSAADYCNNVLQRHDVLCPATAKKDMPLRDAVGDVRAVRRLRRK